MTHGNCDRRSKHDNKVSCIKDGRFTKGSWRPPQILECLFIPYYGTSCWLPFASASGDLVCLVTFRGTYREWWSPMLLAFKGKSFWISGPITINPALDQNLCPSTRCNSFLTWKCRTQVTVLWLFNQKYLILNLDVLNQRDKNQVIRAKKDVSSNVSWGQISGRNMRLTVFSLVSKWQKQLYRNTSLIKIESTSIERGYLSVRSICNNSFTFVPSWYTWPVYRGKFKLICLFAQVSISWHSHRWSK